ncbi:MAG: hypothetical protein ACHQFW_04345, partial [Chitinophagales bacterium]
MSQEFFSLMKFEMMAVVIMFIILFLKLGKIKTDTSGLLVLINLLLSINFIAGFFGNVTGDLFNDIFRTNSLISFEKNLLNLGVLII